MKQTRLLEIIREEIAGALKENEGLEKAAKAAELKAIDAKQKALDAERQATMKGGALEEDLLNEMAYDIVIAQPSELAKLQEKIKDSTKKGEQKLAKALEIIQKTKKEGKPIRQRDIANEMGLIQQEINPLINKLIDVGILEKGESVTGVTKKTVTDKAPKADPNKPKAEKAKVEDDEISAATKAISDDETAKELGSTPEEKKVKFNQFLSSIKKNKDDKAKIDGILKLAKDKFKFAKTMMDDLKRAAGRTVEA